jgi:hypothetical protein
MMKELPSVKSVRKLAREIWDTGTCWLPKHMTGLSLFYAHTTRQGGLNFTHVCTICMTCILLTLNNLCFTWEKHLKFIHKVVNYKRIAKFDFWLHYIFPFGVMPLITLAGSGGIHVLWTHSSIFYAKKNGSENLVL